MRATRSEGIGGPEEVGEKGTVFPFSKISLGFWLFLPGLCRLQIFALTFRGLTSSHL